MPLFLNLNDYAAARGIEYVSACRAMSKTLGGVYDAATGKKKWPLAAVLANAKRKHWSALIEHAKDDGELYVNHPDAMRIVESLDAVLNLDERMRWSRCRSQLFAALHEVPGGQEYLPYVESLGRMILLESRALRFVLTCSPFNPPVEFYRAYAIINAGSNHV